jgi:hypothetical protein
MLLGIESSPKEESPQTDGALSIHCPGVCIRCAGVCRIQLPLSLGPHPPAPSPLASSVNWSQSSGKLRCATQTFHLIKLLIFLLDIDRHVFIDRLKCVDKSGATAF